MTGIKVGRFIRGQHELALAAAAQCDADASSLEARARDKRNEADAYRREAARWAQGTELESNA